MAWSRDVDFLDQDRQWEWVESWAGWDQIPAFDRDGIEVQRGEGWNFLHNDVGGAFPQSSIKGSTVPDRFWTPEEQAAS